MPYRSHLSPIEEIIADAAQGKMCILVDDETRENEGDLVIPADMADATAINFMAKHGRGLICLSLSQERVEHLGLPLMSRYNATRHQTAFTVSIEAATGVTTGISAADRARTIAVAIDPQTHPHDIVTPGHVFPLVARPGGVLVRAGHTEAAVDIARLAGLTPAGVICEIMNDDGTMARMPDLIGFAERHRLKIATIADLIHYRRRHEKIIECSHRSQFESVHGGTFEMRVYTNRLEYAEHIALIKGSVSAQTPTYVRMHALNLLQDVLGDHSGGKANELQHAMQRIAQIGNGVIVLLREPRKTQVSEQILARSEKGAKSPAQLRDYGIGAQILLDLGVHDMILLSNSKRPVVGLEGYGLRIHGYESI